MGVQLFSFENHSYRKYRILMNSGKSGFPNPLLTTLERSGHARHVAEAVLTLRNNYSRVSFEVNVKPDDMGDYELKLFWREFSPAPVFRFESRGNGHFNLVDDCELPARKIENPHFHRIRPDGKMIAERTALLENPKNEQLICEDLYYGVKHFCEEARIRGFDDEDISVQLGGLQLDQVSIDPLEGVSF